MTNDARRRLLIGAVAAGAALAGAGAAWWRLRPQASQPGAADALWLQQFEQPGGGRLDMAALRGKPLLINFWATWCPPCVEEMPLLDRFFRENSASGWQVVGLAIDQPSAVRKFLAHTPVSFPIGLAGLEGTEIGKAMGNSVGGLPFSVLLDSDGQVRQRKMGQLSETELSQWKAAIKT